MNEAGISRSITEHFSQLQDPRHDRTRIHKLSDILVIAMCAITAGQVIAFDGKMPRGSRDGAN